MSKPLPPRLLVLIQFGLLAVACWAVTGCKRSDPIVTYTIPTTVPPQLQLGADRMLAVMLPKGDDVWFFKLSGPENAVKQIEGPFRRFVADIAFDGDGPSLRDLPEGWRRAGEKPMRFASINIDTPGKQIDLSVSKLSRQQDWENQVKTNVNRWRGQIGLEASDDKWAGATEFEIAAADSSGVWVDLIGQSSSGSAMAPPFAQAAAGPLSGGPMPPNHPPIDSPADPADPTGPRSSAPPEPSDSRLSYDRPDGWREGRMSSMRMAAFEVGPAAAPAELTVIPAGGDLKGNVKRWMGQVRNNEVSDAEVDQVVADAAAVEVSGLTGHRYILIGDQETIDATIVPINEGMSLFIKMKGPAKTVAAEEAAIGSFLKSLKLNL